MNTQSKAETFTDKLLAVAFRNRIKGRDLWDLAWLQQTSTIKEPVSLKAKIWEHNKTQEDFFSQFGARVQEIRTHPDAFKNFLEEMLRFIPSRLFYSTASQPEFWTMLGNLLADQEFVCQNNLESVEGRDRWVM